MQIEKRETAKILVPNLLPTKGNIQVEVSVGRHTAREIKVEQVQRAGEVGPGELDHLLEVEATTGIDIGCHGHVDIEIALDSTLGQPGVELDSHGQGPPGSDGGVVTIDEESLHQDILDQAFQRRGGQAIGAVDGIGDPLLQAGRVESQRQVDGGVNPCAEGHVEGRVERERLVDAEVGGECGEIDVENIDRLTGDQPDDVVRVKDVKGNAESTRGAVGLVDDILGRLGEIVLGTIGVLVEVIVDGIDAVLLAGQGGQLRRFAQAAGGVTEIIGKGADHTQRHL